MFEFIQRFFGKPTSSATAKERLRLVLLSDHLSLAPDVVEALKRDLIDVISRYVDVDAMHCDVTFEQQETQVAMLANIPILGLRSRAARPAAAPPLAATPVMQAATVEPELVTGSAPEPDAQGAVQPDAQGAVQPDAAAQPHSPAAPSAASANGRGKRRRRRQAAPISPATSSATPGFSGV